MDARRHPDLPNKTARDLTMTTPQINPTILIDTREQTPLEFKRLPTTRGTLLTGDYSFIGAEELFSVERKSVDDLVSCCAGDKRRRLERELHRLRGFWFARLLIIGSERDIEAHCYRSKMNPRSVLHTVRAFEARYVPVVWEPSVQSAAERIETWVYWFAREMSKSALHVDRVANALAPAYYTGSHLIRVPAC
jgi:ERCC4-type nuclease